MSYTSSNACHDERRRKAPMMSAPLKYQSCRCSGNGRIAFFLLLAMFPNYVSSLLDILQPNQRPRIQAQCPSVHQMSFVVDSEEIVGESSLIQDLNRPVGGIADNRPYEQRAPGPRLARRMNHAFKHLYRHNDHHNEHDRSMSAQNRTSASTAATYQTMSAFEYLLQYFPRGEILAMNQSFPPLLELNVSRHLHPKVRFLQETIGYSLASSAARNTTFPTIPPQYFGARLERTIAPRHAFLVYQGLPSGPQLMEQDASKWREFLLACRKTKRFAALCNQWRQEQQRSVMESNDPHKTSMISPKQIEAFEAIFGRGIMAAARDELVQHNNSWPLQYMPNLSSAEVVDLLIQHGANPLERDNRGVTLLHWACGTGNLPAAQVLLPYFGTNKLASVLERASRDGATPLHWAVAGATSCEFGTGGHIDVCRYLIAACQSTASYGNQYNGVDDSVMQPTAAPENFPQVSCSAKELINTLTYDGNSALMWAAWSGTLETVKLLIRHRADPTVANRNGCTCAHWAASGGNVEVCDYLAKVVNVDFFQPNHGGNTPLTHAVAFGRVGVVDWLRKYQQEKFGDNDFAESDLMAANLAQDFVGWTGGDDKRRNQVLKLFQDDYWYDDDADEGDSARDDDDELDF